MLDAEQANGLPPGLVIPVQHAVSNLAACHTWHQAETPPQVLPDITLHTEKGLLSYREPRQMSGRRWSPLARVRHAARRRTESSIARAGRRPHPDVDGRRVRDHLQLDVGIDGRLPAAANVVLACLSEQLDLWQADGHANSGRALASACPRAIVIALPCLLLHTCSRLQQPSLQQLPVRTGLVAALSQQP